MPDREPPDLTGWARMGAGLFTFGRMQRPHRALLLLRDDSTDPPTFVNRVTGQTFTSVAQAKRHHGYPDVTVVRFVVPAVE